jgi:hypothetical protein
MPNLLKYSAGVWLHPPQRYRRYATKLLHVFNNLDTYFCNKTTLLLLRIHSQVESLPIATFTYQCKYQPLDCRATKC